MSDVTLLALVSNREQYERFKAYVKDYAMCKEAWDLFKGIGTYYEGFPSQKEVDWDIFGTFFFQLKGALKPDKAALYRELLKNVAEKKKELLSSTEPLSDVQQHLLNYYIRQDYATKIANLATEASMGIESKTDPLEDIKKEIHEYEREVGRVVLKDDLFVTPSLSMVTASVFSAGYEWRLEELNQSVGPVRQGDFIILAARPEAGKTTLLAESATHFATQLPEGRPLIWVNNEERSNKVMFRIIQAHFGVVTEDLVKNQAHYEHEFNKQIGNRILLLSDDAGINHVGKLDTLFRDFNPGLIIFDQLDKVYGFGNQEREDLRLGRIYWWAREKAREYGPVITASQVDGTGEGQQWIEQNQLRGSKTDKQGEADAIITIGKVNDPAKDKIRYLHVPKNKLAGGSRTQEALRHGYFEVFIQPEIARYKTNVKGK